MLFITNVGVRIILLSSRHQKAPEEERQEENMAFDKKE